MKFLVICKIIMEKQRNNQQETRRIVSVFFLTELLLIKHFYFIMKQNHYCGSSETIRKTPRFNFDDFYKYGHAEHVPRIDESFLEWFIGFFEGDGSLSYSKESIFVRIRNGKQTKEKVCERLRFSIVQKEKKIIEKICFTFGFGRVSSYRKSNQLYWRWTLESKQSIQKIAFLLSGNLILESRQKQFLKWAELAQKKGLLKTPFNKHKPWSGNICLSNGWLSGFIDAEGCFHAQLKLPVEQKKQIFKFPISKSKWTNKHHQLFETIQWQGRLNQRMILTQISSDQTDILLKKILLLFQGKSFYRFQNTTVQKHTNKYYVRITFSSLMSHEKIIQYLTQYPLKTIKKVSFKRWCRVYFRRRDGMHLSPKGTKRLFRLVKAINIHSKKSYL